MRLIGVISMALIAVSAMAQVDPTRVVATVNGEQIKGAEYYRRMEYLPGVGKIVGRAFANFPPGFLTLEQLITEKLLMQLAKEKNAIPTDAEIDEEMKFALEVDPEVVKDWIATGQSEAEFRAQTRFNLAQFKMLTAGVNVTDSEVDKFYKDNIVMFTNPKVVTLRVIAVQNDDQARAVDQDLAAGKAFADVAKARSLHPSNIKGGDLGKMSVADMTETALKAIENVRVGGITDWMISPGTRAKFQLVAVDPPVAKPLDSTLRKKIRRELLNTKGNIRNGQTVVNDMRAARQKAKVEITQKEFAEAYAAFMRSFTGSSGTNSAGGGGGTGGGGN
jgi:hypothetical protein